MTNIKYFLDNIKYFLDTETHVEHSVRFLMIYELCWECAVGEK